MADDIKNIFNFVKEHNFKDIKRELGFFSSFVENECKINKFDKDLYSDTSQKTG